MLPTGRASLVFRQVNLLAFAITTIVNRPLADITVEPKETIDTYPTFRGSEADVSWAIPNIWLGIELAGLISKFHLLVTE